MALTVGSGQNLSALFSSLNTNNNNSSIGGLSALLGDYNQIKSGSYGKLMKAYYTEVKADDKAANKRTTSTAKDEAATIKELQSTTDNLTKVAADLYKGGSKSVFNKTEKTAEDGTVTSEYDKDAIYKKVSDFADAYNNVLKAGNKSDNDSVVSSVASMIKQTGNNEKMLNDLGITIDSENYRLSVDEDKFKKADMNIAKSLFSGTGSYGYNIAVKSSMVNNYADMDAAKSATYGKNGSYSPNFNAGSLYDSFY